MMSQINNSNSSKITVHNTPYKQWCEKQLSKIKLSYYNPAIKNLSVSNNSRRMTIKKTI